MKLTAQQTILIQNIVNLMDVELSANNKIENVSPADYDDVRLHYENDENFYIIIAPLLINDIIYIMSCSCCDKKKIAVSDLKIFNKFRANYN